MTADEKTVARRTPPCAGWDAVASGLARWIPSVAWMKTYRLAWLPHDVVAGVTLSAVLVPAGMAYAEAAGMPAVSGLYASLAALLAYALFGPSRILVLGPDSALVALIAATIAPLAHNDGAQLSCSLRRLRCCLV
jgi:MFS superfamily sulfate permease-like transporter